MILKRGHASTGSFLHAMVLQKEPIYTFQLFYQQTTPQKHHVARST